MFGLICHLTVALETRLNEQELGNGQRPRSRRRTDSSNSEEEVNNETNQVTRTSPMPTAALTPVSIEMPPWSAPMASFLTPTISEPVTVGEEISQQIMSTDLDRVPVALHLTAITCSDL